MEQVEIIQICKRFSGLPTQGLADLWTACERTGNLEGAVVECGVLNGGAGAALWHAAGARRHLWLFDSFAGMPEPTEQDGGRAGCQYTYRTARPEGWNIGEIKTVKRVLSLVKVPRKLTHIIKGWFSETLPGTVDAIWAIVANHLYAEFY
jgi:O-methyltransferase